MSINYWDELGNTVGQGIADYASIRRAKQLQDQQLAQQNADRQRQQQIQNEQMAAQRADMLKNYIAGQVASGNNQGAAATLPQFFKDFNTAAHTNLQGPAILGALKTVGTGQEQTRPTGFVGPMPEQTKQVHDFNTAGTDSAILRAIGVAPKAPQVEIRPLGNGGYLKVTTNPDGTVSTEEHAGAAKPIILPQGAKAVDANGNPIAEGNPKTFAPKGPGRSGGSGRTAKERTPLQVEKDIIALARSQTPPRDSYNGESTDSYQKRLDAKILEVRRQFHMAPPAPPAPPAAQYPGAPLSVTAIDAAQAAEYAKKKGLAKHGFKQETN